MIPQPMSWSEPREDETNPLAQADLAHALEQQVAAGFPPGLALDLVLNELVVRAATATRASGAALALIRGEEMVCRAATGEHAPDLGIPLNISDGVSGACVRTRRSQLCLDTETDPRVDSATCRRLGIRSMLVVPVLQDSDLVGVLEVFSIEPAEFVDSDQNLLEIFARDVARIRRVALDLESSPIPREVSLSSAPAFSSVRGMERANRHSAYEVWSLVLGALAILLAVALSFVIGSRIGWLGFSSHSVAATRVPAVESDQSSRPVTATKPSAAPAGNARSSAAPSDPNDGLVVYDRGKIVFRMNPNRTKSVAAPAPNPGTPAGMARVWLAEDLAQTRLRHRIEPLYPPDALAAHRSGDVVLEVIVDAEGSVESLRALSGDPLLATAAADAVRNWRYEPYRVEGRPAEFQTDVTLKFSLPN